MVQNIFPVLELYLYTNTGAQIFSFQMIFSKFRFLEAKWVRLRFSPRKLLFKSEAKLVEVSVTLLMGSQSFCSDPLPPSHPLSRQTVHDCPWLLLWCCSLMPRLSLSVTLGWQFSLRARNLSCLWLSPVWRQGHQVITGLGMRARPPVGGLLVILHWLQEEMAFLCPLSRNCSLTLHNKGEIWHF